MTDECDKGGEAEDQGAIRLTDDASKGDATANSAGRGIERINAWYIANCDGDWEHQQGVVIETLDNPGWRIQVDLSGTTKATSEFEPVERLHETEWISLKVQGETLQGACSPTVLSEMLEHIGRWLEG